MFFTFCIVVLNLSILVTAALLISRSLKLWKKPPTLWMVMLVSAFSWISFCALIVYISGDLETKGLFSRLRFVGLAFLAPCWLLFLTSAFRRWTWICSRQGASLLLAPAVVTALLTLFHGTALVRSFEPIEVAGFSVVRTELGSWFPIHYGWSVLITLLGFVFAASIYRSLDSNKRLQLVLLMTGSLLGVLVDTMVVGFGMPWRWLMITSSTYLFTEGAVFYTVLHHGLVDLSPLAMNKVFHDFPDPILVVDENDCVREASDSALKMFDFSRHNFGQSLASLLSQKPVSEQEISLVDKNGEERHFEVHDEPIRDAQETLVGRLLFFREITFQKGIEQRLSMNIEFKSNLMSVVAHDLSTSLSTQLLLSRDLQTEEEFASHEKIKILNESIQASQELLLNLLSWVRADQGHFEPRKRPYELNAVVGQAIESLRSMAALSAIDIRFESDLSPILAIGDSAMVEAIVRNLLANALRATKGGGEVLLRTEVCGQEMRISVLDQGHGITPEKLEILRGTSSQEIVPYGSPKSGGFGIGWILIRRFVELQRGSLQIESQVGAGTRIFLNIPLNIEGDHLGRVLRPGLR